MTKYHLKLIYARAYAFTHIIGKTFEESHIFINKPQFHAVIGKQVNISGNIKMDVSILLIASSVMDGK
jgi:hypothetical protein